MAKKTSEQISTFEQLMKGNLWRSIRALLKRTKKSLRISVSEEAMGQYAAVILNGDGFVQEHGKAGLQAAFTGQRFRYSKISSVERLREMIWDYDGSLPPEDELVQSILKDVETIRRESGRPKKAPKRRRARANA